MRQVSFNIQKPDLRLFINVFVIIGIFLCSVEMLLRIPWVVSFLPTPSPALSYPFPEVGLKFERYFNLGHVNCLFFGSSMVDVGVDPELIEKRLNLVPRQHITCMNFGLSGSQTETSSEVARTLVNWQTTDLVLFGISPIEFDEKEKDSRQMKNAAVFQKNRNPIEYKLFANLRFPWFYYGLLNRKDKDFIRTENSYNELLNSHGFRINDKNKAGDIKNQEFYLHDFYPNPVDLKSLDEIVKLMKDKGIKIVVFEMPVRPSYFPFLVEGGRNMYELRFVTPIQQILQKYGMTFIRTQPEIGNILGDDYWFNENHLNYSGSQIFTNFLANQILQRGDW